jgi:TolB-like protein/tetratricopeptide (TPR) repeat protein
VVVSAVAIGLGVVTWTANRFLVRPAAIEPYSLQDRRMTFAVLPFQPPAGDTNGARIAAAMTEAATVAEEDRPLWAQVASRKSVEQAVARHATDRDLASELNVHFLVRGNVTPGAPGYNVGIMVVDGATERVLDSKMFPIGDGTLTPRARAEFDRTLGWLTYKALEAEVQRGRGKSPNAIDVRDLSFRAFVEWNERKGQRDEKGAYTTATNLLNRALAIAPDDPLALKLTAQINLCDCVEGWSKNVEEQQAIGAAAMDRYLLKDPQSPSILVLKSELLALHGRFEESLLVLESVLKRDPEDTDALAVKAYDLLKLGKLQEALVAQNAVRERRDHWSDAALAASIHYALEQYGLAAQMAQKAKAEMRREELANPRMGPVVLTLAAAEARIGRSGSAKVALADFNAAVPGVDTISAIKKWMHPAADLAGYEPLYEGLRLAGVGD